MTDLKPRLNLKDNSPSKDILKTKAQKKPGRPKTIMKERRTISARIPVELLDKWEEVKLLKGDNFTEYLESLIQKDMDENYERLIKLKELIK